MSFLPNPVLGGNKTRQSFTRQVSARASRGGQTPAASFLFKGTGGEENPIPVLLRREGNVQELPPTPPPRAVDILLKMEMLGSSWWQTTEGK